MRDEFGALGSSLIRDLSLAGVGHMSALDALDAGYDARDVWLALCEEADVPAHRRYGVGLLEPKER